VIHRAEGHGSSPDTVPPEADAATTLFRPHRLFVLHHVQRTLVVSTSATQYLMFKDGVGNVVARLVDALDRWTSSEASVSASTIGTLSPRSRRSPRSLGSAPNGLAPRAVASTKMRWLRERGIVDIRAIREELGHAANLMDENQLLHVLAA